VKSAAVWSHARLTAWQVAGAAGWAVLVAWLAFYEGGFPDTSWAGATVGVLFMGCAVVLTNRQLRISFRGWAFLGGLAGLAGWAAISQLWTSGLVGAGDEVLRDLMYVSLALVAVALASSSALRVAHVGLLTGIAVQAVFGDLVHLVPDQLGVYSDPTAPGRLHTPVGYWDAQGALAALGLILASGMCLQARDRGERAFVGALVPVLGLNLYFTYSRGGVLTLTIGWVCMLLLVRNRAALFVMTWVLALACVPLGFVLYADRRWFGDSYGSASASAGHRVLVVALLTTGATACLARIQWEPYARTASTWIAAHSKFRAVLLLAGVVALVALAIFSVGDLGSTKAPRNQSRLSSGSLNGRGEIWLVALDEWRTNPVVGGGAGSFAGTWDARRTTATEVEFAHSLYLQTLAELGMVGALLLGLFVVVPLTRLRAVAVVPSGAPVAACIVAYLFHAGIDWDWQMPVVTSVAIVCCGSVLYPLDRSPPVARGAIIHKASFAGCASVLAAIACIGWIGSHALDRSRTLESSGRWSDAAAEARTAATWQPWSAAPDLALAQADLGIGNLRGARHAYQSAVEQAPRAWQAWLGLASTLSGPPRMVALRRASSLNPLGLELRFACRASRAYGCPSRVPRSLNWSARPG
jgi:O-antigen ligase/polysaccharide polymerase Wzy-like membrane protein